MASAHRAKHQRKLIPIISKSLLSVVAADGTRMGKQVPSALGKPVDPASSAVAGKHQLHRLIPGFAPLPTLPPIEISGQAIQAVWAFVLFWDALDSPQSLRNPLVRADTNRRTLKHIFVAQGIVRAGPESFQPFVENFRICVSRFP
jgi:hypothetical protein